MVATVNQPGMSTVKAKIAFLVIAVGGIGAGLLSLRQQRLEVVHEVATIQKQLSAMDQDLFRVRVGIAQAITPQRVVNLAGNLGPMVPIGVDPIPAAPSLPVVQVASTDGERLRRSEHTPR